MKIKLQFSVALMLATAAISHAALAAPESTGQERPSVASLLEEALRLTGGDPYLAITRNLQCHMPGPDGVPIDSTTNSTPRPVQPTKVFDNLYYIGSSRTGSWLFTTPDGYIMIDAMYGDSPETVTVPGMLALGLDPAKLKYILITHAGPDYAGGAKYFPEKHGTRVLMSRQDWDAMLNPAPGSWVLNNRAPADRPASQRAWVGPPHFDLVGHDGDSLTLGGLTLKMYFTPRISTGGGLSFIAPVTDRGEPHIWATYGNTGLSDSPAGRQLYRESVQRFMGVMEEAGVDTIIAATP